jgi:hypothetical protein
MFAPSILRLLLGARYQMRIIMRVVMIAFVHNGRKKVAKRNRTREARATGGVGLMRGRRWRNSLKHTATKRDRQPPGCDHCY